MDAVKNQGCYSDRLATGPTHVQLLLLGILSCTLDQQNPTPAETTHCLVLQSLTLSYAFVECNDVSELQRIISFYKDKPQGKKKKPRWSWVKTCKTVHIHRTTRLSATTETCSTRDMMSGNHMSDACNRRSYTKHSCHVRQDRGRGTMIGSWRAHAV